MNRQVTLTCLVCGERIRRSDNDHTEAWTVNKDLTQTVRAWHNPCSPEIQWTMTILERKLATTSPEDRP